MNELLPQKLGRILRLDRQLNVSPRPRWVATIFLHSLFGLLMIAMLIAWRHQQPADPDMPAVVVFVGGYWLVFGVIVAVQTRWARSFELQLLPGAVQLTNWGRTVLLVEPEVVGGRIANVICLRAGEASASIPLYALPELHDRAAVVEHCSQFLSPEQQARFGHEWAAQHYRLITPRKPADPLRTLVFVVICFALGGVVLVGCYETICWKNPDVFVGQNFRAAYVGWIVLTAMLAVSPAVDVWRRARR